MPGHGRGSKKEKEKGAAAPEKSAEEKRREAAATMGQALASGEEIPIITSKKEQNAIKKRIKDLMDADPNLTHTNADALAVREFVAARNKRQEDARQTEINKKIKAEAASQRAIEKSERFKTFKALGPQAGGTELQRMEQERQTQISTINDLLKQLSENEGALEIAQQRYEELLTRHTEGQEREYEESSERTNYMIENQRLKAQLAAQVLNVAQAITQLEEELNLDTQMFGEVMQGRQILEGENINLHEQIRMLNEEATQRVQQIQNINIEHYAQIQHGQGLLQGVRGNLDLLAAELQERQRMQELQEQQGQERLQRVQAQEQEQEHIRLEIIRQQEIERQTDQILDYNLRLAEIQAGMGAGPPPREYHRITTRLPERQIQPQRQVEQLVIENIPIEQRAITTQAHQPERQVHQLTTEQVAAVNTAIDINQLTYTLEQLITRHLRLQEGFANLNRQFGESRMRRLFDLAQYQHLPRDYDVEELLAGLEVAARVDIAQENQEREFEQPHMEAGPSRLLAALAAARGLLSGAVTGGPGMRGGPIARAITNIENNPAFDPAHNPFVQNNPFDPTTAVEVYGGAAGPPAYNPFDPTTALEVSGGAAGPPNDLFIVRHGLPYEDIAPMADIGIQPQVFVPAEPFPQIIQPEDILGEYIGNVEDLDRIERLEIPGLRRRGLVGNIASFIANVIGRLTNSRVAQYVQREPRRAAVYIGALMYGTNSIFNQHYNLLGMGPILNAAFVYTTGFNPNIITNMMIYNAPAAIMNFINTIQPYVYPVTYEAATAAGMGIWAGAVGIGLAGRGAIRNITFAPGPTQDPTHAPPPSTGRERARIIPNPRTIPSVQRSRPSPNAQNPIPGISTGNRGLSYVPPVGIYKKKQTNEHDKYYNKILEISKLRAVNEMVNAIKDAKILKSGQLLLSKYNLSNDELMKKMISSVINFINTKDEKYAKEASEMLLVLNYKKYTQMMGKQKADYMKAARPQYSRPVINQSQYF